MTSTLSTMPACGLSASLRAEARLAATLLSNGSAIGVRQARRHVLRMRAGARDGSASEQALASVLQDWWRGRRRAALRGLATLAIQDRGDCDLAMWAMQLACLEGDCGVLEQLSVGWLAHRPELAIAHAIRSYVLVQRSLDREAVRFATRALEMDEQQPLAQIVFAGLCERAGRLDEALAFLSARRISWRRGYWRQVLLATLARLQLASGKADEALHIVNGELLHAARSDAWVLQKVIALLTLADAAGADTGALWRMVGDMVAARWHEHVHPLLDLHFVFALARDGREQAVRAFLASMERVGEADNSGIWESVVLPMARGAVLLARGDEAMARSAVAPLRDRFHLVGGCRQDRGLLLRAFDGAPASVIVSGGGGACRAPSAGA